jgi:hypothetical protein
MTGVSPPSPHSAFLKNRVDDVLLQGLHYSGPLQTHTLFFCKLFSIPLCFSLNPYLGRYTSRMLKG